jgi:hypothetical protein
LNTSRAIKKGGLKIAVFVNYELESKYKKSSKFEEVMVQKVSDFIWIESLLLEKKRNYAYFGS